VPSAAAPAGAQAGAPGGTPTAGPAGVQSRTPTGGQAGSQSGTATAGLAGSLGGTATAGQAGGQGNAPPPATATPQPNAIVRITPDGKLDPPEVTIDRGQRVQWQNQGRAPQALTDDPARAQDKSHAGFPAGAQPFDSGPLNSGQSFTQQFDVPGEYRYFSVPAEGQGLVGRITVRG
jgi:plastocyanin